MGGIPCSGIVVEWVISDTFCVACADFGRYEVVPVYELRSITTTTTTTTTTTITITGSCARDIQFCFRCRKTRGTLFENLHSAIFVLKSISVVWFFGGIPYAAVFGRVVTW